MASGLNVEKKMQKYQLRKGWEGEVWEGESVAFDSGGLSPFFSEQLEEKAWLVHLPLGKVY